MGGGRPLGVKCATKRIGSGAVGLSCEFFWETKADKVGLARWQRGFMALWGGFDWVCFWCALVRGGARNGGRNAWESGAIGCAEGGVPGLEARVTLELKLGRSAHHLYLRGALRARVVLARSARWGGGEMLGKVRENFFESVDFVF